MQSQLDKRRVLSETEEKVEVAKKVNPYLRYIFQKPEFIEVEEGETLVPIRTITMGAKELLTVKETVEVQEEISRAYNVLKNEFYVEPVKKASLPRWTDWYTTPKSVKIRDVLDILIDEFKPFFPNLDYSTFTSEEYLDQQFRVSRRLYNAINSKDQVKSIVFRNEDGGLDIFAEIESFSYKSVNYYIMISVNKEGIRTFCSCPAGNTICKHQIAVIASHIPEIMGALLGIGDHEKVNKMMKKVANKHLEAIEKLGFLETKGYENVWEAYIYYFIKMLKNLNLIKPMKASKYDRDNFGELIKQVIRTGTLPKELSVIKTKTITRERVETNKKVEIVWTDEMKVAVEKVRTIIKDLQTRFGRKSGVSDWAEILTFAMIMSADYNKPPITIHALGDIGTFKTTGSRLIAQYVKLPELLIRGRGEPRAVYEKILEAISSSFGIPPSAIFNKIGGIITSVSRKGNTVEVGVSIPYLYSILSAKGRDLKDFIKFKDRLKELGFELETRYIGMNVDVKDHMQLAKIEHYRFSYVPDEKLGLLTKSDVFDNYVLVIDEGSRNPEALEGMLTKMSISSLNEGVRIIIVTDNLEPHIEMVRNPRYGPLYDRMFMAITSGIIDEMTVMENLYRDPPIKMDMVSILGIQKFIESIPVSEETIYVIKSVGNALSYKFTKVYTEEGEKFLKPIRRNERAPIEIDVLAGTPDFDFTPGNRFTVHTIQLAKFNAFLNENGEVTYEDVEKSLYTTIPSRLIVDASTYSEYKAVIAEIVDNVVSKIPAMREAMKKVAELVSALNKKEYDRAERVFNEIIDKIDDNPEYAPVLMSGLELFMALREFNIDEIPKPIAYTIGEIALIKGDLRMLVGTKTFKELREIHKKMVNVR